MIGVKNKRKQRKKEGKDEKGKEKIDKSKE